MKLNKEFIDIDFNKAKELIQTHITPTQNYRYIPLEEALDKICLEDINALRDAPLFDNSAMDGYVFKMSDAPSSAKKVFKIKDTIFAGDFTAYTLNENECCKIMTGAMIPKECNIVVPFEQAISSSSDEVELSMEVKEYQNIRLRAIEFTKNKLLVRANEPITPQVIALLISQGITHIKVSKDFNIAIISSGDEIIEPWQNANEFQIYNSNTLTLQSLLLKYGFKADYKGVFPDNLDKCVDFIKTLGNYDAIITTGGVSMGEADFVGEAFMKNNMSAIFHKIKIKPGRPMLFGQIGKTDIFALPGNPMSSFVMGLNFIIPALFKKLGSRNTFFNTSLAINQSAFRTSYGKVTVVLGKLVANEFRAINDNKYNSGMLSPLVEANAIALIDKDKKEILRNEPLRVITLFSPLIDTKVEVLN